ERRSNNRVVTEKNSCSTGTAGSSVNVNENSPRSPTREASLHGRGGSSLASSRSVAPQAVASATTGERIARSTASFSPQCVEIGGHVARVLRCDAEVRHRGAFVDRLRIHDPADETLWVVRQHATDERPLRKLGERRCGTS